MNERLAVRGSEIPTRVLIESMVRADGTIDAGALYSVANALGMTDQQVRLCIRRIVADGQFTQEGRGRRAVLRATAAMRSALDPDVEFVRYAYDQDRGLAPWDGRWHLVAFAIPESSRQARDAMRDGIVRLGGAFIQGGLYVAANPWEPYVDTLITNLGVNNHVSMMTSTDLQVGEASSPTRLAARLWPLAEIADRHRRLLNLATRHQPRLDGRKKLSDTEYLTIAIELAAEFDRAMVPDPLLPPELLPKNWIGARARLAFARCWARLQDVGSVSAPQLFQRFVDAIPSEVSTDSARS